MKFSWASSSTQIGIWEIYGLYTWQPTQVQVHIVHMVANLNSSLYCAQGNQLESKFTAMMKHIKIGYDTMHHY